MAAAPAAALPVPRAKASANHDRRRYTLTAAAVTSSFVPSPSAAGRVAPTRLRPPPRCSLLTRRCRPDGLLHILTAAATTARAPPGSRVMAAARCPALDRRAAKHHRLRFVRKLTTLLLSKPRHFLPLRILSRHCRRYLSLAGTPGRSVLSMVLRYPAIFRLFHAPSHSSQSLFVLAVGLTPAAAALAAEELRLREEIASFLAAKLQRLLMLTPHRRLLLSKLVHLGPDLGLPPDFRSRLCNRHPDRFRTVDTSYGRALELVNWDPALAVPLPPPAPDADDVRRPIIDRPPRFKQLKLRRGLNLKRRHRDYLVRFRDLPEVSPFSPERPGEAGTAEKRACAAVREVLGMTAERRTLVDHLTHLRRDLGLPNRLRAMLVRHAEMFYVSVKGQRDSVFLVEGYDDRGRLLHSDELLVAKERLLALVHEEKRLRKGRGKSTAYDDDDDEEEEEEEEARAEDGDDDGFAGLFDSGIGEEWEEWEEFSAGDGDDDRRCTEEEETSKFWSVKRCLTTSDEPGIW